MADITLTSAQQNLLENQNVFRQQQTVTQNTHSAQSQQSERSNDQDSKNIDQQVRAASHVDGKLTNQQQASASAVVAGSDPKNAATSADALNSASLADADQSASGGGAAGTPNAPPARGGLQGFIQSAQANLDAAQQSAAANADALRQGNLSKSDQKRLSSNANEAEKNYQKLSNQFTSQLQGAMSSQAMYDQYNSFSAKQRTASNTREMAWQSRQGAFTSGQDVSRDEESYANERSTQQTQKPAAAVKSTPEQLHTRREQAVAEAKDAREQQDRGQEVIQKNAQGDSFGRQPQTSERNKAAFAAQDSLMPQQEESYGAATQKKPALDLQTRLQQV